MIDLRRILSLPKDEQLEACLEALRDVGATDQLAISVMRTFQLNRRRGLVLAHILRRAGRTVSYEDLLSRFYDPDHTTDNVKQDILFIRRPLPKDAIRNVRGAGYIMDPTVAEDLEADARALTKESAMLPNLRPKREFFDPHHEKMKERLAETQRRVRENLTRAKVDVSARVTHPKDAYDLALSRVGDEVRALGVTSPAFRPASMAMHEVLTKLADDNPYR